MRTEKEIQTRIDELEKKQSRTINDLNWEEWNKEIWVLLWVLKKNKKY